MNNSLGKKFSFISLLAFAMPNIIMMVFLSLYTIIDGIFISRFVGTTALSAVNMSFPVNCIEMAVGIMFSTGGSAIIARRMGEGDEKTARENFTLIVMLSIAIGIFVAIFCNLFMDNIIILLGTGQAQFDYCKSYTTILVSFAPAFFLQTAFQTLFVTAGKPGIGLLTTVFGGIANMVLDYIFVAKLNMGIVGAAYATVIGYLVPSVCGVLYFSINRNGSLYFTKFKIDYKMLLKSCTNGSSEMVTNLSNAVTTFLYNIIFMYFYGEDGVAAITIVLYFQFVFTAIYFGFSLGTAPVFSFKYGCRDKEQIRAVFRYSIIFIIICSFVSYIASMVVIKPVLKIFTEQYSNVYNIALEGFKFFDVSFVVMGINIFASSMFTAFSDGKVSAIISFCRTFVFLVIALVFLPYVMGKNGAWLAVSVAEMLGVIVSFYYLVSRKNIYNYK